MSELASLIDPSKRIGTVTRVTASAVELTLPNALAALGQRGLAKGSVGDFVFVAEPGAERVLVVDVRAIHAVQHKVHRCDPEHRRVEIEPVEHLTADVLAVVLQKVAGVDLLGLAGFGIGFLDYPFLGGMFLHQVLHCLDKEAAGAGRGVTYRLGRLRIKQFHHQLDDVPRRSKQRTTATVAGSEGQVSGNRTSLRPDLWRDRQRCPDAAS